MILFGAKYHFELGFEDCFLGLYSNLEYSFGMALGEWSLVNAA